MSYYATQDGVIRLTLTNEEKEDLEQAIRDKYGYEWGYPGEYAGSVYIDRIECELIPEGRSEEIYILGDVKYRDDQIKEFLEILKPYTSAGEIDFVGEDNTLWRYWFEDGVWYEEDGYIRYSNRRELK